MDTEILFYITIVFLFIYLAGGLLVKRDNMLGRNLCALAWYAFLVTAIIYIYLYTKSILITILSLPALYIPIHITDYNGRNKVSI